MFAFKYAEYIVPAFAITAIVFAGLLWTSLGHARRWRKRYEELSANDGK
jgi:heme exporter protein CcmD